MFTVDLLTAASMFGRYRYHAVRSGAGLPVYLRLFQGVGQAWPTAKLIEHTKVRHLIRTSCACCWRVNESLILDVIDVSLNW
jgi:hypothetical protein